MQLMGGGAALGQSSAFRGKIGPEYKHSVTYVARAITTQKRYPEKRVIM